MLVKLAALLNMLAILPFAGAFAAGSTVFSAVSGTFAVVSEADRFV